MAQNDQFGNVAARDSDSNQNSGASGKDTVRENIGDEVTEEDIKYLARQLAEGHSPSLDRIDAIIFRLLAAEITDGGEDAVREFHDGVIRELVSDYVDEKTLTAAVDAAHRNDALRSEWDAYGTGVEGEMNGTTRSARSAGSSTARSAAGSAGSSTPEQELLSTSPSSTAGIEGRGRLQGRTGTGKNRSRTTREDELDEYGTGVEGDN